MLNEWRNELMNKHIGVCFNPHNPTREVLFIIHFLCKLGNWDTKMLCVLPEILQLVSGTVKIQDQVAWLPVLILHHHTTLSLSTITCTVFSECFLHSEGLFWHFAYLAPPSNWITDEKLPRVCSLSEGVQRSVFRCLQAGSRAWLITTAPHCLSPSRRILICMKQMLRQQRERATLSL